MFDDPENKYYKKLEEIQKKLEANPHLPPHTQVMWMWMLWEAYDETSTGPAPCETECPREIACESLHAEDFGIDNKKEETCDSCKQTCYLEVFNLLREMIELEFKEKIIALESEKRKLEIALIESESMTRKKSSK